MRIRSIREPSTEVGLVNVEFWQQVIPGCPWLTVQAILCVTASTRPAADGWPLPLFFTPPKGRWTSAPMHGKFT